MSEYLHNRRRTGPLTLRQVSILRRLGRGESHAAIGVALGLHAGSVSQDVAVARTKLGVKNSAEAIALVARHDAYLQAAHVLLGAVLRNPDGEAEEHVNHVIRGIARSLELAAEGMLPQ